MSMDATFEVAPNIHCLRVAPTPQFCYNSFLLVDERPTLIHTGRAKYFTNTLALARTLVAVERLAYIVFSHFEADECGALNKWLEVAPSAVALVGPIGKPSIDDIATRPPECIADGQMISLGRLALQVLETPHFPHGWDACMYYEPTHRILFSSDFGAQPGTVDSITTSDVSGAALRFQDDYGFLSEGNDFMHSLERVAGLPIHTLATQHGALLRGPAVEALFNRMRSEANREVRARVKVHCEDFA